MQLLPYIVSHKGRSGIWPVIVKIQASLLVEVQTARYATYLLFLFSLDLCFISEKVFSCFRSNAQSSYVYSEKYSLTKNQQPFVAFIEHCLSF